MKIRNGFVSNSSSSSFILMAKSDIPTSDELRRQFVNTKRVFRYLETQDILKLKKEAKKYLGKYTGVAYRDTETMEITFQPFHIYIDYPGEVSYNRGDIQRLDSVPDKVKYVYALYVMYQCNYNYDEFDHNLEKLFGHLLNVKKKIAELGEKYNYAIHIELPNIKFRWEDKWDEEKNESYETGFVEPNAQVSTECSYAKKIVDMVDSEDTHLLEEFLFNPKSFAILGGDEYNETDVLKKEAAQEVDYEYDMFTDEPDCDEGDYWYTDKDGVDHYYTWTYHWQDMNNYK
jgi:hypothetical protein